jgi:diguanylate cyclase
VRADKSSMESHRGAWSRALLALGLLSCAAYVMFAPSDLAGGVWYLATAALGTGMAIAGAWTARPPRRRIWVALALGSVLYLVGDSLWEWYDDVLHVSPYPSWADAAYLSRYVAVVLGLCWLVRGRKVGRDRAAFLEAAILTSAFALPATMFFILPIFSESSTSVFSMAVAAAYPIGDVFILAVLLRLMTGPAARNLAFLCLTAGLAVLLGADVYYNLLVSWNVALPTWMDGCYLLMYLLIGFAAMHSSRDHLSEPTARRVARPVALRVLMLGCASLLAPGLLAVLVISHSLQDALLIAIGGAVSSALVLVRLFDLLRYSESQSVQLAVLARTDGLTGLPNRRSWDHQLARATEDARAEGTVLIVAMIDFDQFKLYNDTKGHNAGDLALKESAAAWAHLLDGNGYIARYGGEEFALFIPDAPPAVADALIKRVHESVARGQTCSMGVAEWQPDEQPAHAIARADEALYEAKRRGRDRIVWHGRADLPRGPVSPVGHDIVPLFQPIIDLRTGVTVGREALSRFPQLSPNDAFARARVVGDTGPLERAAIYAALAADDRGTGWLSLNVSLSTILDPRLEEVLPRELANIVFEITEYENLLDRDSARERLLELRARGARMAIDDLGVGFSSLDRLLWLEPEIIKLDLSIVRDVNTKPSHVAMIHALVGYAAATGAELCAEGVETEDERRVLSAAGVHLAQGYLFGRPKPARDGKPAPSNLEPAPTGR